MNSATIHRTLLAFAGLLCLTASPAAGQSNEQAAEAHHRNDCRLAAQVLRTGHPAPKRAWAQEYISMCAEEGPAVLADQWRMVSDDSVAVTALVIGSPRIRDARIYNALRSVVDDPNRPDRVRVGAMLVLAQYVDPHNGMGFQDVRPPNGTVRYIPLVINWVTHATQVPGSEPLPGAVGQEVLTALRRLADRRDSESRTVWYAAAVLARRVERDIRQGRGQ